MRKAFKKYFFLYAVILAGFTTVYTIAQPGKGRTEDIALPENITLKLQAAKKDNNLAVWLEIIREYISENPSAHFNLYHYAETAAWRNLQNNDADECTAYFNLLLQKAYDLLKTKGWVPESIDYYEKADSFYNANTKYIVYNNEEYTQYLLQPLANCYTRIGDNESAIHIQNKIINIAIAAKDSLTTAITYGNLAVAYRWNNNLPESFVALKKGMGFITDRGSYNNTYLNALLADFYYLNKQPDSAYKINKVIVSEYKLLLSNATPDSLSIYAVDLSASLRLSSQLMDTLQHKNESLPLLFQALNLLDKYFPDGLKREKANLLSLIANKYLTIKDVHNAGIYFDRTLQTLLPDITLEQYNTTAVTEIIPDNVIIDAVSGKAEIALLQQQPQQALQLMMLASRLEQQLRSKYLNTLSKFNQVVFSRQRTEKFLKIAVPLFRQTADTLLGLAILEQIERTKAQVLLEEWQLNNPGNLLSQNKEMNRLAQRLLFYRQQYVHNTDTATRQELAVKINDLEYRLAIERQHSNRAGGVLASLQKSTGSELLQTGKDGQLMINYFAGDKNVYALIIAGKHIQTVLQLPVAAPQLQQVVENYMRTYYYNGPMKMQEQPADFCKTSFELFRHLLPVNDLLQYRSLIIIPDEHLYKLPFDALQTTATNSTNPQQWPYMAKHSNVTYAFSMQLLHLQQQAAGDAGAETHSGTHRSSGFAGYFVSAFNNNYPVLPQTIEEYQLLRKLVKGNMVLNNKATLHNLKQDLQQAAFVHISTHNIVADTHTALALYDSLFYNWELQSISSVPKLVLLNTCKSAAGQLQTGEGVMSMGRYFTAAGSNAVIAALWNINDASGARFIINLYKQLQTVHNAGQALQLTRRNWLNEPHPQTALYLPYYWANLSYTGTEQQMILQYKTGIPFAVWWVTASGIVILCIGMYCMKRRKQVKIISPHKG